MFPHIIGMACTDEVGRLYFEHNNKKRLIARHPNVPSWVSPMDLSVLKRFLDLHWKDGTLVVIGPNTYQDAQRLLADHTRKHRSKIMISHAKHYCLVNNQGQGDPVPYDVDNSLKGLRVAARQLSLDNNLKQILVMGGRSVYCAFAGHYDHFTHCQVTTDERQRPHESGAIKVPEILKSDDDLDDRLTHASVFEQPKYCVSTPLAEDEYSVTQYDRMQ